MKLYRRMVRPLLGYPGQHMEPKTELIEPDGRWYPEEEIAVLKEKYKSLNRDRDWQNVIFEDKYIEVTVVKKMFGSLNKKEE